VDSRTGLQPIGSGCNQFVSGNVRREVIRKCVSQRAAAGCCSLQQLPHVVQIAHAMADPVPVRRLLTNVFGDVDAIVSLRAIAAVAKVARAMGDPRSCEAYLDPKVWLILGLVCPDVMLQAAAACGEGRACHG
jgi:hypothetical protein